MTFHRTILAAAFASIAIGAAHANGLRPIEAKSIDLGDVSGVAPNAVEISRHDEQVLVRAAAVTN